MTAQSVLPPDVLQALNDAEKDVAPEPAEIIPPSDTHFTLAAGYLDLDGNWHTDFEVRELTGRDEEAIAKTTKLGTLMMEIISRGLVRVGPHEGPKVVDGLVAGDWETVFLAIRSVTFGPTADYIVSCRDCRNEFEVTVHLQDDIPMTRLEDPEDLGFRYTGRHGVEYEVSLPLGSTQRKMLQNLDRTTAEQNTLMLKDCVERINGRAALPEQILNMPLADRRTLLKMILERRPGPRLEEVTSLCPNCGAENLMPLSIAALFQ